MLHDLLQLGGLQIILGIAIVFIAYMVKGLSGFGSGLIAIPLLAFLFPLTVVVPALGLLSYSGTLFQSFHYRKQVIWRDLIPLVPFSVFGIVTAIWLLVNVDANRLVLALGIFVVLYSLYSLLPLTLSAGSRLWAIAAGSFGGMVGALFGTGGPFYALYLKMRKLDKAQFRATFATVFLIDGGTRMAGYAVSGLFTEQVLTLVVVLFPVLLLAMFAGHHIHIKIDQRRFNQVISVLLLLSGSLLIYKSLSV